MDKIDSSSLDITKLNVEKIKELFPNVVTEGKIDFDVLRNVLGDEVDDSKEKYQFTWKGKSAAIKLAQSPSTATLRPSKQDSKDWNTTENLYIEGDNLEVLKQLQKTYYGKIKMIYIDPPYNTGNDFVYKDDFKDSIEKYKEHTNQNMKSNPETNGRYHTDWLNMMYPRLLIAKNLLLDEGLLFISIDDNEVHNLKKISDEIFGEDNFLGIITWSKKRKGSFLTKDIISLTEYLIVYSKNKYLNKGIFGGKANEKESQPIIKRTNKLSILSVPENVIKTKLENGFYKKGIYGDEINPIELLNDVVVKDGIITNNFMIKAPFIWSQKLFDEQLNLGAKFVVNTINFQIRVYKVYGDDNFKGYPSYINGVDIKGTNEDAYEELENMFGIKKVFDYSKPVNYIKNIVNGACYFDKNSIILDFFSGSATTAHAVMQLNAEDNGNRKFICVQLDEKVNENFEVYKAGFRNICEIGKERIRRAGEKIKEEWLKDNANEGLFAEEQKEFPYDIGFKVFKLDSTNILPWDNELEMDEKTLFKHSSEVFKEDRSKEDVLYEILLKYGVFDMRVSEIELNGKKMYQVGKRYMLVCLEDEISNDDIKAIIGQSPKTVVFQESGFLNDNDKINAIYNLEKAGVEDIKCI